MTRPDSRPPARSRLRRAAAALAALALGAGLAVGAAGPASAGVFTIGIAATNATTQPSGSVFTYQVSLACAATNDPTCDDGRVVIPLDEGIGMPDWTIEAVGGLVVSSEIVDGELVITLPSVIAAGTSQAIELRVTPPNLTTPDGTSWSLLPSVEGNPETTEPATAPTPATGTATATVPLSVSKGSDRTFYREGETVTYTITASCPAEKPLGSIDAASMTIVDTLPVGIDPVLPVPGAAWDADERTLTWQYATPESVPEACGGEPGEAAPASFGFQATVGAVGEEGSEDPLTRYVPVRNAVEVTASPLGGGTSSTAGDERDIVPLADGDDPTPGTVNVDKGAAGPVNSSDEGSPRFDATYPGRWLPNGVAPDAPASVTAPAPARYTIEPRTQFPGFEYAITDPVPCLDDSTGPVYGPSDGVCADPAFHVLGVRIDHPGEAPGAGYAPRLVDLAGAEHELEADASGSNWTGWVIPTAFLGQVSGLVVPRDPAQQDRRSDRITVYGYADVALEDGDVLQNVVHAGWFSPSDGPGAEPLLEDVDSADLLIVDQPQIGVTKTMANVGAATGPLARLELSASLLSPGVPDRPLVLTDLLPLGASLETARDDVAGELRPEGGAAIPLTADELAVEVIPDYAEGRELLRVTVPASALTAAGRHTLVLDPLEVRKPTEPGVYDNSAQAFYDSAELAGACAAGSVGNGDPLGLRGDDSASEEHCAASATFSTVTSTSGAFDLRKTVQGDYDETPQEFPNVGHVRLTDGLADYELLWQNTGAPVLEGLVLYDVFPHVGDTGVSGTQASQERESEFRPRLESVGAPPAGVTISYSASENPCRPEVYPGQGACDDDWTEDPADLGGLAEVMAIRLVSAESYPTGAGVALPFQMSVPTVDRDLIAWNSVAAYAETTGGTALLPTESPKVGITASDERLALEKSVDADAAEPGDRLVYEIAVTNVGTRDSVPATVTDVLPEGVSLVSASDGGVYDAATRTVTWTAPALARDESVAFELVVTVDAIQADDEIVNAASLENPPGYSPPVVGTPCADDPAASCARTTVPPSEMAVTGTTIAAGAIGAAALAILIGAAVLAARSRREATGREEA